MSIATRRPLLALAVPLLVAALDATGCIDRPLAPIEPGSHRISAKKLRVTPRDSVDLLLVVDNSASMADKQGELSKRIPELVAALTTPRTGPDGRVRVTRDMHVGVITTSLGSHGTAACDPRGNPRRDDGGRLLPRSADPAPTQGWQVGAVGSEPTPASCPALVASSALLWRYDATGAPAGARTGAAGAATTQTAASCIVASAHDDGCGFEETWESVYHFLIDPTPYAKAEARCAIDGNRDACVGDVQMTLGNQVLLDERAAFLRPDSVVAVVVLSDENDSSLMPIGDHWKPWSLSHRMVHGWTGCRGVPDSFEPAGQADDARLLADWSCRSCEDDGGDPACAEAAGFARRDAGPNLDVDDVNLRAFAQVQRFGRNFLWPVGRYVDGLTKPQAVGSDGKLGPNPLYADGGRVPADVIVAGIVGVPRSLVADATGAPRALTEADWKKLVSDDRAERDPHMIESIAPRPGIPRFAGDPTVDAINGGDREIPGGDDLQYACIAARAVDTHVDGTCDGPNPEQHDPICGAGRTTPRFKAYPGLRHLRILHDLGPSGFVASICDRSYAPALRGVVERIAAALEEDCLTTPIDVDEAGNVQCLVIEAFAEPAVDGKSRCEELGKGYCTPGAEPCRIANSDYPPLTPEEAAAQLYLPISARSLDGVARDQSRRAYAKSQSVFVDGADGRTHLVCELMQLAGGRVSAAQTAACTHDPSFSIAPGAGGGFCYARDAAVVGEGCRHLGAAGKIRFVGDVTPTAAAEVFTYCVQ